VHVHAFCLSAPALPHKVETLLDFKNSLLPLSRTFWFPQDRRYSIFYIWGIPPAENWCWGYVECVWLVAGVKQPHLARGDSRDPAVAQASRQSSESRAAERSAAVSRRDRAGSVHRTGQSTSTTVVRATQRRRSGGAAGGGRPVGSAGQRPLDQQQRRVPGHLSGTGGPDSAAER